MDTKKLLRCPECRVIWDANDKARKSIALDNYCCQAKSKPYKKAVKLGH